MAETSRWVGWYYQKRLHSSINHRTPNEIRKET